MFIDEIDSDFLRDDSNKQELKYRKLSVENYRFAKKIENKFLPEEAVRQWFIDSLIGEFGYSENDIDLEYSVQSFSKTGYVDIVVLLDNKPFIFVECKSYSSNLDIAKKQLLSYMETDKNVRYGVITNGKEIRILKKQNSKIIEVNELPRYEDLKIDAYRIIKYTDLLRKEQFELKKHMQDGEMTLLKNLTKNQEVEVQETVKVQSYGNVAAGNLKPVDVDLEDISLLPRNLLERNNEYFMLRVEGIV